MPATYGFLRPERLHELVEEYSSPERWCRLIARYDARVLVADARGRVLGTATFAIPDERSWWGTADSYLGSLYVRDRGRGIGARLVERVIEVARSFPPDHIVAEAAERNTGALRFLARHGFEPFGGAEWLGTEWRRLRRALRAPD